MKDTANHGVLNEYVSRLKKEALLKAILCALAIGFGAVLLTALICWFTEFSGYWIFAITFSVPFGVSLPLFYLFVFYPTKKYVAKRLDKLGLDERILTMVEFGEQESYIMQRQRADAIATLGKFNSKLVKFALSAALIAIPAVAIPTATAMTSVYALSEADVIPSGKDLIDELNRDKSAFELIYKIPESQKDFGVLYSASNPEGEAEITLKVGKGLNGEAIIPVAEKGYVFRGWSDGVRDVIRQDVFVQGKIVVTAIFEELDLEFTDDKDTDSNEPKRIGNGNGNDHNSDPSGPVPPPSNGESDPTKDPNNSKYKLDQFVYDGQTDYSGEPYQDAYDKAMGELNQSGGADGASKDVAADYFEAIKKN